MLIGLTYDLRSEYLAAGLGEEETAEFDRESTVAAFEGALRELGHQTDRIGHARQLIDRLSAGSRWDLVFNIAEGMSGIAREAQVPAILDVYGIPYTFSDPLVLALTLHKGLTKTVVRAAGVPTAPFAVVERLADVAAVQLPYPLFAKPIAEGTGKGVTPASKVRDAAELEQTCSRLLAQFQQPVLVETFLPGREFTIGMIGTGAEAYALGTMEILLLATAEAEVYSYVNKEYCEGRVEYRLVRPDEDPVVRAAEEVALRAWRTLNCRDGGRIDIRCDASGAPSFLEVNPLAGIHPEHSDLPILATMLGITYTDLIGRIVASAQQRIASAPVSLAQKFDSRQGRAQ
ncbi:Ddl-like protein [Anatilimnocola aggregata]|uniref:Ddl-like protein n=1 Tax=Anatilimnocola aggregata TaxID=2528021 RepID=A0A517YM20_9BACT|nr:D-alanine--D-alanine ligase [Anatilimnocola aggregata]QDU31268.1 Ddl-like protein [Anatilimnocola aggregata]